MSAAIRISLNPPYNNEYYSTNDTISGNVTVSLKKSLTIKQINVILKGFTETVTKTTPSNFNNTDNMMTPVQDNKSFHNLVTLTERVFPPDNVWHAIEGSSKPFKIKPGEYEYKFQFSKLPKKPKCLINHTKDLICFSKREETRLPPSFNNQWKDLIKIDNLDLFYYAYGKVIYSVQVQIELGKASSWYKPFHRLIREIQAIEFIPEPSEMLYDDKEDEINEGNGNAQSSSRESSSRAPDLSRNNSRLGINATDVQSMNGYNMNPQTMEQDTRGPTLLPTERLRRYTSSYRLGLPDGSSTMWVEVRSRCLRETYRGDYLFRKRSGKFDHIYLIMKGNLKEFDKFQITPIRIQFNLLETVTYLSQGIANENLSSLRLVEINNIPSKIQSVLLDFGKSKLIPNKFNNEESTRLECEINLKDHPILKKIRFNEEDYKHRGNRLYSFKTCSIKRIFNFQLLIDWDINGTFRQTENIINPMQVFVQTNEVRKNDVLPKYVDPPTYTESTPTPM